jgi:hypothetical protein
MTPKYATPDFMPVLSSGAHSSAERGACVMEYVSVLAGETWSDTPRTVHPGLGHVARSINDQMGGADQVALQGLAVLAPRFIGTAAAAYPGDDVNYVSSFLTSRTPSDLDKRLALWAVKGLPAALLPEAARELMRPVLADLDAHDGVSTTVYIHPVSRALTTLRREMYPARRTMPDYAMWNANGPLTASGSTFTISPGTYAYDADEAIPLGAGFDQGTAARLCIAACEQFLALHAPGEDNRTSAYTALIDCVLAVGYASGTAAMPAKLAEMLDEFDRLTGHALTDGPSPTQPDEPADPDTPDTDQPEPVPAVITFAGSLAISDQQLVAAPLPFHSWANDVMTKLLTTASK